MKNIKAVLVVAIMVTLSPTIVWAGPCDATFNFDGNLSDSSGNGNDGTMIGKGGVPAKPVFVKGRSGKALRFDGTSAMRAPLDLYIKNCPQVTISAWVKIDVESPKTTQFLLSTGSGSGPGIRVSGTGLSLNGPANGLFKANAIRPNSGWLFVAGVYDYDAGTFALYWRDRPIEFVPMSPNIREWEDMLWVGAMNDLLSPAATGIVIDDVRIEGKASTFDDLHSLKTNIPAGAPGADGVFRSDQSSASEGGECTAAQVAGSYRSEFNNMQCNPEGRASISCCYGAECRSTVTLAVAADGQSATGFWKQPDGTSGSATFQIDESCSLAGGQWGYGTAAATRPWDTTGVVIRVGSSDTASDPGGSGGDISPPSGRVVIPGPVEQIEESAEDALPDAGSTTDSVSPLDGRVVIPGPAEQIEGSVEEALPDASNTTNPVLPPDGQVVMPIPAEQIGESAENALPEGSGQTSGSSGSESSDETTTRTQALSSAPGFGPTGDPVYSGVSGFSGTSRTRIDLESSAMTGIAWLENANRPCHIAIWGTGNNDKEWNSSCNTDVTWNRLQPQRASERAVSFNYMPSSPDDRYLIRALRVCNNRENNHRLKGIQIFAAIIDADGNRVDLPDTRTETQTNCRVWDQTVSCPANTLATGLMVQANKSTGEREQIVGLALICRELAVQ